MFGQQQPAIRLSRPTDINNLRDLDVKCYDYPLNMEQWQALISSSGKSEEARCVLVEYQSAIGSGNKPIGFGVWQKNEREFNILRLGVHKDYRRQGIGTLIIDTIVKDAVKKAIKQIFVTVPDLHCEPGDPDDASQFLVAVGFKTNGKIVPEFRHMYGQYRDGYTFEKNIECNS